MAISVDKKIRAKEPYSFPTTAARNRIPLKTENGSIANEVNMMMTAMGNPSPRPTSSPLPSFSDAEKENRLGLSLLLSPKNFKPILKREDAIARQSSETAKLRQMQEELKQMLVEKEKAEALLKQQENAIQSLSKQLEETHEKLNHVCLEKEKTQDLLEEKGNVLRLKDEHLEKLRFQLNKLRKLKEFKPTLNLSFIQEEVEKKTASPEKKRPSSSAYMMWRKDHWEMVKKENPNAKLKEICNILALKWKNLSAEEKKPYEARHLADKKSHLEIIKKGSENKTDLAREEQRQQAAIELLEQYLLFRKETDKEIKKTRKELDPSKPKKPLSAFFLFLNERRSALLAEKKNAFEVKTKIAIVAGEEWRNMNEEEQAPYKETAKKLKEEHLLQMELYKQNKEAPLKKEEEEGKEFTVGSFATARYDESWEI